MILKEGYLYKILYNNITKNYVFEVDWIDRINPGDYFPVKGTIIYGDGIGDPVNFPISIEGMPGQELIEIGHYKDYPEYFL